MKGTKKLIYLSKAILNCNINHANLLESHLINNIIKEINQVVEKYYGLVFKEIRKQKKLSQSFFEKIGVKKSCISKFEHGVSMMSFERIYKMLEAMDVSLEEYELLLNRFSPPFMEEFFIELENAELYQKVGKLSKLYDEAIDSSNFFLALIVKSKITSLTSDETQRILSYLYNIKYWGYFELSLLQAILITLGQKDILKVFIIFMERVDNYNNIFKYTRKIFLIAYQFVMILTARGERELAVKILNQTTNSNRTDFDFFISNLRYLAIAFMKFRFGNPEEGMQEINDYLLITKKLGGNFLYIYYRKQIKFYINEINQNSQ